MTGETERERFLLSILDTVGEPIMIVSRDYRILYVNKAAAARVGTYGGEMIGKKCYQVFDGADAPPAFCPAAKTLAGEGPTCVVREFRVPGDEGTFEEVTTAPFGENGGPPQRFIETIRNVTKEKRLEQTLINSERLIVLGELAAGIAHEVNNPMGIILGFAQDLLTEIGPQHPAYQNAKIIEEEAKRCGHIFRSLLEFTRPMAPHYTPTDLAALLRRSIELIASTAKKRRVAVVARIRDGLPLLSVDPQQIQQVLVNLFLNALDAMPEGGTLTVTAQAALDGTPAGADGVEIGVSDTGHGIADDDLARLFLPFFTRKPHGMGLGLSISKRIIEAHQGALSVGSAYGHGATFTIRLPVQREGTPAGGSA